MITEQKAISIAKKKCGNGWKYFSTYDELPVECAISDAKTNCWYIICDKPRRAGLDNSRLICISRNTGEVISDDKLLYQLN